jgi:heterodisulfide reductase subunit C
MITVQGPQALELLEQLAKAGDGKPPLGCMQCGLCAGS